ncbi:ABCB family ABC transporter ATP-binding protein/permease [Cereibacter johrii]|uniref:ATP-binding cassette subfamily B protein n=1 Tax=Cereibacter johrii TaxID=445629 RepID=A0ABX5J936_9RHOB|nr:ABC transporter ATP-binding protein/permease [Cereibacter johrii]RDS95051.1 ABC transporter ATP-binding protein/permease [Cereibacter sphaeroides f. sp. denitrificans]MEA5162270.1 ABC transporter ATP-binding protein/permease [Cereibacter johrii]ODM42741.1 metal ABC transporter permease [Cereibacter johrii]PTM79966.1 ATP-binding cassette subfamily B protein [Cereibacter johrii]RAZ83247.1 ABC transporter ATP-binding protein/permease [Cereibacter johrii]
MSEARQRPGPTPVDPPELSGWATMKRMAPYLWPKGQTWVKRRVVIAMAMLVLAKVISVSTPFFYKAAVDALAGDAPTPAFMLGLGAVGMTVAYGLARLGAVAFGELRDAIFVRVGQRALRQLALETFTHIHRLSLRYHISRKTGGLSRIIERGVKGVDFLLRFMLFSIGPLFIELTLVAIIFAVVFGWEYMVVVVATIALYVAFTFKVTEWRVQIRRQMNEQDTDANQKAIDSLLNFETVKYFGAELREAERYDAAMAGYEKAAVKTGQSLAFLNAGQSLLITAGLVAVMAMAAYGVQAGRLTVGDFVMVNAYMIQITLPLGFLGTVYREIRQALVDMGQMFGLLAQPAEVSDAPEARPLAVAGGTVELENVRFGYDAGRTILKGISLRVEAGETVALVGPSGSGKSTIGRLLFRFYDVNEGAIRIDGQDLRAVTQDSLHAQIGVVPQDTVLFNDTIFYNIAYGRPDATPEQVEAAARAAKIHDFILRLPEGYRTMVGERGLKLSGGEKQRVGIARTLLKNPPILLLDEATSALDTQTERDIQDSLREMGEGRTVITIAHRLSTIADADRIVVLEEGRIVEEGRHEQLLARGGRYAAMWARQSAEEEDEAAA